MDRKLPNDSCRKEKCPHGSAEEHTQLVNDVLVELSKLDYVRAWKNQTGVAEMGDRIVRFGLKGSSDIIGLVRHKFHDVGVFIGIECKTGGAVQTPQQKSFQAMIERFGGFYLVVRDPAEALQFVKRVATSL